MCVCVCSVKISSGASICYIPKKNTIVNLCVRGKKRAGEKCSQNFVRAVYCIILYRLKGDDLPVKLCISWSLLQLAYNNPFQKAFIVVAISSVPRILAQMSPRWNEKGGGVELFWKQTFHSQISNLTNGYNGKFKKKTEKTSEDGIVRVARKLISIKLKFLIARKLLSNGKNFVHGPLCRLLYLHNCMNAKRIAEMM